MWVFGWFQLETWILETCLGFNPSESNSGTKHIAVDQCGNFISDTLEKECPLSILSILCNFILLNLHHSFDCPVFLQPSSCCFGGSTWSESRQGSAVWYSTWAMTAMTAMTLIWCFSDALIADANKAWWLKFLLVWCCGWTCMENIWFTSGGLIQLSLEQSSISFLHLGDQLDLDLNG